MGDPVRELGPTVRILAAVIDAVIAYGELSDDALARVDTAILREGPERQGWVRSRSQRLLSQRGWTTIDDLYDEAQIPKDRRPAVGLDALGFEDEEISRYLDVPLRTVQLWLHDERPKLRRIAAFGPF